jgi:hypothetical protein
VWTGVNEINNVFMTIFCFIPFLLPWSRDILIAGYEEENYRYYRDAALPRAAVSGHNHV